MSTEKLPDFKEIAQVTMTAVATCFLILLFVGCGAACIGGFCGVVMRAFEAVR